MPLDCKWQDYCIERAFVMQFNGFVKVYQLLQLLYVFLIAEQDAGLVTWAIVGKMLLFCVRLNDCTKFIS